MNTIVYKEHEVEAEEVIDLLKKVINQYVFSVDSGVVPTLFNNDPIKKDDLIVETFREHKGTVKVIAAFILNESEHVYKNVLSIRYDIHKNKLLANYSYLRWDATAVHAYLKMLTDMQVLKP